MPYITREDGERFVIPSYRDVLTVRQSSQLKKEINALSQNYGEYVNLRRKANNQYEVAFSADAGYLLGETVWHYLKKPADLIYCEAIPNTTEAILVIVKNGSVYLDGSFPLDSIPEELVIFLTQQNNFEIYVYGDVPISETTEPNKFSFEASSVKSFNRLEKPLFPSLPLLKIYQLQLVDTALRQMGIGVFPTGTVVAGVLLLAGIWLAWHYLTSEKVAVIIPRFQADPYQGYRAALTTPAADQELSQLVSNTRILFTMPGWTPTNITYNNGTANITVESLGGSVEDLIRWATYSGFKVNIDPAGISLNGVMNLPDKRSPPTQIYTLNNVLARLIDQLADIYPGNNMKLGNVAPKNVYSQVVMTINVSDASPMLLELISQIFRDLPVALQNVTLAINNGKFSGTVNLLIVGK